MNKRLKLSSELDGD